MFLRSWPLVGTALLAVTCAGCGAKNVKVNGKILKGGKPLVVSKDTYVTISFAPDNSGADAKTADTKSSSYSAKFDHESGTYTAEMPAGKYKSMVVIVPPPKAGGEGKLSAPLPPTVSDSAHDLTKSRELDLAVK